ncbi:MAG: 2-oxoglutarate oxidoreductase, alpha subunit (EC [uncultured Campylobacterales bacterium]|uniref:2-oxoglutarate oxidoreductase, alpha subunit (EC) n=1 Tax=uncultured Campylobacterales bacterium TaxID=352960 RepID=A0A6S6T9K5_9BACT|nr:MAG: 2-oxoglutarate oxidoreductase, alpha subunit (EC [uncultured Campylobacterales bacterium]
MGRKLITTGNDLVSMAALEAGCNFFAGYPITPSSDIMHNMSVELPKFDGHFIQMEDEIGSVCAAIGASMSGAKAMTGSSGPGISLKSEQIGYSFITEVPLVIVNVMRGGPSTGLPTHVSQADVGQAKYPTHGDYASISLCPGSLEECYSMTIEAFNLAEKYMTPVFLLLDETVGHMQSEVELPDLEDVKKMVINREVYTGDKDTYEPYNAPMDKPAVLNPFFKGYKYHVTGLHHGHKGFPTEDPVQSQYNIDRLTGKVNNNRGDIVKYAEYMLDDADICIIAYGSISRSAKSAIAKLREKGIKAGMFRPITLWPSPDKQLQEIGKKFKHIFVTELNMGQYLEEVQRCTKRDDIGTLHRANGKPIPPLEIVAKVEEML